MPNGGSDCCGTCWFNSKNRGEAGYGHTNSVEPDHCEIRNLPIEFAFYTYCANHPNHTRERIRFPIGPVFVHEDHGRKVWVSPPDTEEIRIGLLNLLSQIQEEPPPNYPAGLGLDDAVIFQLGEYREPRAVRELERVVQFDATRIGLDQGTFARNQVRTIGFAREALAKIISVQCVDPSWLQWNEGAVRKLAESITIEMAFDRLPILADALQDAGCGDAVLLAHLRDSQPHNRWCWVVDLLLGKGTPVQSD